MNQQFLDDVRNIHDDEPIELITLLSLFLDDFILTNFDL